jgi:hypothetical protein
MEEQIESVIKIFFSFPSGKIYTCETLKIIYKSTKLKDIGLKLEYANKICALLVSFIYNSYSDITSMILVLI